MPTIIINKHQLTQAIYLGILFFILSCSKKDSSPVIVRPSAPTNIEATAGDGQATIRFSPPTNNGGANIIGYTVVSVPGNITASGLQSPITITGLTNGVTYQFKVVATNSSGIGDESVLSNSITPIAAIIVNRTCSVVSISRYNNGTQSDYAMTVFYDFVNRPVRMIMYDSLRKVKEYEASFVYQSDAIIIDQNQSFKIDPTTQHIKSFITRDNLADPKSDVFLYEYIYNDSGYLITKNKYINGSQKPIYTTTYVYDNNNLLIGCNMVLTSTNQKLLESTITYETSKIIKSFIYNFPDGFESFKFSPILNFGKKMKYPVKTMVTKLYDPSKNTLLDTWTSSFGSYSYTSDNYINQGTQTGDLQQGFGMFYGKTSFTYLCQ